MVHRALRSADFGLRNEEKPEIRGETSEVRGQRQRALKTWGMKYREVN
jgi:hypothetical protein